MCMKGYNEISEQKEMIKKSNVDLVFKTICLEPLVILINKKNIFEVSNLSIRDLKEFVSNLKLTKEQAEISEIIVKEINSRLEFLMNVGLDYLSLSRSAGTLSGGESQRIRLATQIGSRLTGVLYVLDEPSIGLHQRDNRKLIDSLLKMRDLGNSLIVVEHDTDTMLAADYLVDIGPGAGDTGAVRLFNASAMKYARFPNRPHLAPHFFMKLL